MVLQSDALIAAYQSSTDVIRDRVVAYVLAVWGASSSYRDSDVDRIVARIVPVVQSGQLQVARLTDAYIGRLASLSGVSWVPGLDRAVVDYRGVPAGVVYRRPAVQLYTALSDGLDYTAAVSQGTNRLKSIVTTDIQQAKNRQAQSSLGKSGFTVYKRRLSGLENCDLCQSASENTYSRGDLMPIHPGCDCSVEGVNGHMRASTAPSKVVVNEHGELGPTLGWAADNFTGPADL